GLSLVITENSHQADRLCAELEFFLDPAGGPAPRILRFPDWETLPYDSFSPHQDIVSERLSTLHQLPGLSQGVLVLSVNTLLQRLPPRHYVQGNTLQLAVGQRLSIESMRQNLQGAGYHCVDTVYEHGEFAVRGSIMDLYPMGSDLPCRIELFDDEIESLRHFDPETQVSSGKVEAIELLPGREYPLTAGAIEGFRKAFREAFDVDVRKCPVYEDVSKGIASAGVEYYLPLFFNELETLFAYLPARVNCYMFGDLEGGAELFWRGVRSRYDDLGVDPERPLLPPARLFLGVEELFSALGDMPVTELQAGTSDRSDAHNLETRHLPDLAIEQKAEAPLQRLESFRREHPELPLLFCCDSAGRREAVLELLRRIQLEPVVLASWQDYLEKRPPLGITVAPLESGVWLERLPVALITENQLFIHHVSQQRRRGAQADNTDFIIKSLTELKAGDPVVHLDHGVGRYHGLTSFDVEGQLTEFLVM